MCIAACVCTCAHMHAINLHAIITYIIPTCTISCVVNNVVGVYAYFIVCGRGTWVTGWEPLSVLIQYLVVIFLQ